MDWKDKELRLGALGRSRFLPGLGRPAALLAGGWFAATILCLGLGDATSFLDLPLGAYLAGQGALLGVVIVGVRVVRGDRDDD